MNPHERFAHYALNVARLPVPPLRRVVINYKKRISLHLSPVKFNAGQVYFVFGVKFCPQVVFSDVTWRLLLACTRCWNQGARLIRRRRRMDAQHIDDKLIPARQ